ncbi:MAG TPA: hypothetical protein DHU59_03905, partial [Clostridiales bacterium]|nr:hypothetical protein [Clostridiales bacterium]
MNLFSKELKILNIGTSKFKNDLELQGQKVIQLDWEPAANGDIALLEIVDRLSIRDDIKEANK